MDDAVRHQETRARHSTTPNARATFDGDARERGVGVGVVDVVGVGADAQ
jgi:hypothetical protein